MHKKTTIIYGIVVFCMSAGFFSHAAALEQDPARVSEIEAQIVQLEREAGELDTTLQQVQSETRSFANEVKGFDTEIKRREVEIKRLTLAIQKAGIEIADRTQGISTLTKKIEKGRHGLAASIVVLSAVEDDNPLTVLLKHRSLSDFFTSLYNLHKVQSDVQEKLAVFKDDRTTYERERDDLLEYQEEQQTLKSLQDVERRFIAQKKLEKDELLRLTRGKEAIFQQLLKSKQRDIATLKSQLFYLEKTGIIAEEAVALAEAAAERAGIRTAFLLALLEVETGKQFEDGKISVGTNLGTGNWRRDLYECYQSIGKPKTAEAEKTAFFRITEELGLDPDAMKVSRRPNYGCGGAMGPAQFLPSTWLGFAPRVARLTGHNPPSPWDAGDAFTAAAIFLADAGADAQTVAGETRAAKTYLSGQPNCSKVVCRSYANRIIALARDIDRAF